MPRFKRNRTYELHRGFAFKDLSKDEDSLIWKTPDGRKTITDAQASRINKTRRTQLTVRDAWNDLKLVSPNSAKELGWNGFQRLMQKTNGSKKQVFDKIVSHFGFTGATIFEIADPNLPPDRQHPSNLRWGES